MTAYYNEIDRGAAAWIRELIECGLIPQGVVDERSIAEVQPSDLKGFRQCHFFAGIGGWAYALRLAGWSDTRPVWTGSCPCQPFSGAGRGAGFDDARHLWPQWFRLIRECRPPVVFGEQVAAPAGLVWLDLIQADLEAQGYATGAADLCAAGVGAPHIRQRLWFVADAGSKRRQQIGERAFGDEGSDGRGAYGDHELAGDGQDGAGIGVANSVSERRQGGLPGRQNSKWETELGHTGRSSSVSRLANPNGRDSSAERKQRGGEHRQQQEDAGSVQQLEHFESDGRVQRRPEPSGGVTASRRGESPSFWSDCIWLPCSDGKWRPAQPEIFPLASGIPNRVGLLRGAGNSIVPQVAQVFIEAYCVARDEGTSG